jgi:hypothetical protein
MSTRLRVGFGPLRLAVEARIPLGTCVVGDRLFHLSTPVANP